MKSQIKDIVIGIFAVIGFSAIVMGFNNPAEPQQVTYATPESHVWEVWGLDNDFFMYNKVTGVVRKLNSNAFLGDKDGQDFMYAEMIPLPENLRSKAK